MFRTEISLHAGPRLPDDPCGGAVDSGFFVEMGPACDFGRPVPGAVSRVHEGSRHRVDYFAENDGRMRIKTTDALTAA
jgi:hypothetical protein